MGPPDRTRSTPLVARAAELARVREAVRRGTGVVVAGEAGVGKTALMAAVAAEVPGTVLWVAATEASRLTPYGALGSLLPDELGAVHPAVVPPLVVRRLRELAPVLLAVDDAQLLDEHSAAALHAAVTAGAAPVVITLRTGVRASDAVTALWKDGLLDRLDLDRLDRADAHALLTGRLGGEVASGTVELLWARSQGNPLYLTELARFGADTGRLRREGGIWWWTGGADLPPRLGELLARRLDAVPPAAREAQDVLALGEPLPWDTLAAVVGTPAILELDEHGLITGDEVGGVLRLRFSHPLLHAVAAGRLTPARRRTLAERLRQAPAGDVDVVRRAAWEEAAGTPDPSVLTEAADAVMLSDPAGAVRFAARAVAHDPGPRAAIALSAAHAELGELAPAREALRVAATRVRDAADRLVLAFEEISLTLWTGRDPDAALAVLAGLDLGPAYADELESATGLVLLFSGRPAAALERADAVLARSPDTAALVRALTIRVAALTMADRPGIRAEADRLLAAVRGADLPATRIALARAIAASARLSADPGAGLPRAAGSGRWPSARDDDGPVWSLLEGLRRQLAGDRAGAVAPLREAYVQQQAGEGLFRSEAVARLVVALAEAGEPREAAELLAEHPPDRVAVEPGLGSWAAAAVAYAFGRTAVAGELALAAGSAAAAAGAPGTALRYLADAARYGVAPAAAAAAASLGSTGEVSVARAAGIRARAVGDPDALLAAAERHLAVGLRGAAAQLAELAARLDPQSGPAAALVAGGGAPPVPRAAEELPAGLTPRELEIARMAAAGRSDKEIADELVVSVRTVGSHLAAAYRKLGIRGRRELTAALPDAAGRPPERLEPWHPS